MEKQMKLLLSQITEKFNEQTKTLTTEITKNVMEALDEKLKILREENNDLKTKVNSLEQKISYYEKEKRRNNLVFFGIDGKGKTELELVDHIKEIVEESGTNLDSQEISNIQRIGKQSENNFPILISLTTSWKKHLILKNKRHLPPNVYVKEDFPKNVLEIRKQLQPKMEEERKKGNIAYIKYDKLIVKKPGTINREKRKRETTKSPNTQSQKKQNIVNTTKIATPQNSAREVIKPSILAYVSRDRSNSMPELPKNK
ncbi:unnamed protein product [Chilo suppressalis]|uniref:Endonuclease-reverse transcriptase n=1 Tax=Chilo suppressalis TaxID=168631 RepID=A0ABN8B621_CHISP|nr:unnamed protein product [Chilo suppressalis]